MLKLLLTQTTRSTSGSVYKYFLDLADELEADATVLRHRPGGGGLAPTSSHSAGKWLSGYFTPSRRYIRRSVRQAVESSRLFSYDLILVGRENKRELFWSSPSASLAQTAWAPVMLIPEGASFSPYQNILFIDDQALKNEQPLLIKFRGLWRQKCLLYPFKREKHSIGSYYARRFDETGYPAAPRLDAVHLQQYVERHKVGLVVASEGKNDFGRQALNKLSVPTLIFNFRNTVITHPRPSGRRLTPQPALRSNKA